MYGHKGNLTPDKLGRWQCQRISMGAFFEGMVAKCWLHFFGIPNFGGEMLAEKNPALTNTGFFL